MVKRGTDVLISKPRKQGTLIIATVDVIDETNSHVKSRDRNSGRRRWVVINSKTTTRSTPLVVTW